MTYFLPREEVKNCFHVIKEALDKISDYTKILQEV